MRSQRFQSRDERKCLFQSRSLPFPTVHPHLNFRSQVQPSIIPIPSRCQAHTSISSHLLLFFMDILKPPVNSQRMEVFWYQKELKIKLKIQMSTYILGHIWTKRSFSKRYRLIRLMWVGNWKCSVFIPFHSHQAIPMFSHSHGTRVVLPISTGFPWDPWEFLV